MIRLSSVFWLSVFHCGAYGQNSSAPSLMPSMDAFNETAMPSSDFNGIGESASCSAYAACSSLTGDCCPTIDDVFLYCCFEPEVTEGYETDFTLVGPSQEVNMDEAEYFLSSSTYFNPGTAPDGSFPVIAYTRNDTDFDMIYYRADMIVDDAAEYVSEAKKFFVDIYSTAPPCTQILLQLDNLGLSNPNNFPIGRHSRYITFTTKQRAWERLEFDFLDRPDETMSDVIIDAIALFFSPGLASTDTYYMRNLDSANSGCLSNCEVPSPKACAAPLTGESGQCNDGIDNDEDGLTDCEDFECTLSEACTVSVSLAYAKASNQLDTSEAETRGTSEAPRVLGTIVSFMMLFSVWAALEI